jgi:hypothetical protein
MRQVTTAADRIDYWIRRRIVPCSPPRDANPACDRYIGLTTAIGRSLRDQYDALTAPMPPHLSALVRQFDAH